MATNVFRIACAKCDRDDFDGVEALPSDWEDIAEAATTANDSQWWTHIGLCPDCRQAQP